MKNNSKKQEFKRIQVNPDWVPLVDDPEKNKIEISYKYDENLNKLECIEIFFNYSQYKVMNYNDNDNMNVKYDEHDIRGLEEPIEILKDKLKVSIDHIAGHEVYVISYIQIMDINCKDEILELLRNITREQYYEFIFYLRNNPLYSKYEKASDEYKKKYNIENKEQRDYLFYLKDLESQYLITEQQMDLIEKIFKKL